MMTLTINNPASCEIPALCQFLHAKGLNAPKVYCELCKIYGIIVMSKEQVSQWYCEFKNSCTYIHRQSS